MLSKISKLIAKNMVLRTKEDKEKEPIYIYGIEIMITTFVGIFSILFLSGICSDLASGVIFIFTFVPLRLFTGGYHASTYGKCFILSNLSYISILFFKNIAWNKIPFWIWFLILMSVSSYITKSAPVINVNQPISEYKQQRSRKIAKGILFVEIVWIAYLSRAKRELMSMSILSIFLVAVFMLIADKNILRKTIGKEVTGL